MATGDKKPVVMTGDIGQEGGVSPYLHAVQHKTDGADPIKPADIGAYSLTRGTAIPENADLDTYITPGSFICQTTAISKTVVNSPVTTTGWSLQVEIISGASSNYLHQTLRVNNETADVWKRRYHPTSGWGEWGRVATTDDLAAKPAQYALPLEDGIKKQRQNVYFKTQDNVVTIHAELVWVDGITEDNTVIATLPEGFRDTAREQSFPVTWWFEGTSTASASRAPGAIVITTAGVIKARIAKKDIVEGTQTNIFIHASFVSNE